MSKFYHFAEYRVPAKNAEGCKVISRVIGCDAETLDGAFADRCRVRREIGESRIVAISTHNVGMGPACK